MISMDSRFLPRFEQNNLTEKNYVGSNQGIHWYHFNPTFLWKFNFTLVRRLISALIWDISGLWNRSDGRDYREKRIVISRFLAPYILLISWNSWLYQYTTEKYWSKVLATKFLMKSCVQEIDGAHLTQSLGRADIIRAQSKKDNEEAAAAL